MTNHNHTFNFRRASGFGEIQHGFVTMLPPERVYFYLGVL